MAETAIAVKSISETETDLTARIDADETNGNKVTNPNGDVFLILLNSSATDAATVTVTAQETSKDIEGYGPMTKVDLVVDLALGEEKMVGPFPQRAWNDSSDDIILAITGTAAADVKIDALKLG